MKYLTLMPDYTGSCIRDDFEGQIEPTLLGLPQSFLRRLYTWQDLYKKIIPLDQDEREKKIHEIERLDQEGLSLAKELRQLIPGGAKVKYFSEGLGKIIHS